MSVNLKEYFKLSMIYTVLAAFPPLLQLLIQPIIEGPELLNAIDFSHIAIVESINSVALVLASMSMGSALVRYYYDHMNQEKEFKLIVSSTFNSILFRGMILIGIAFIFQDFIGKLFSQSELQDFGKYGIASIGIGISRAINLCAANLLRNQKKVINFVWLSLAMGLVRGIFQLIGLFYFEMSFLGYTYGSLIGGSLVTVVVLYLTYSKYGFSHNRKAIKPLYSFAYPLFQYSIMNWALMFADRYFLESDPVDLGIYDTAIKYSAGIEMIMIGLHGAVRPELFRYMKEGIEYHEFEIRRLSNIFLAQMKLLIAISIIPVMLFLTVFFQTELRFASGIIAIVFIKYLLKAQFYVFSTPLYYMKFTRAFFWLNTISLLLNLLLNYFLIPIYGIYGAIIAGIAAQFVMMELTFGYQQKKVPIKWNFSKIHHYPLLIVALTCGIEFLKVFGGLDPYVGAVFIVLTIIISLIILYKKDIKSILKNNLLK